jgi:hypothetical protein
VQRERLGQHARPLFAPRTRPQAHGLNTARALTCSFTAARGHRAWAVGDSGTAALGRSPIPPAPIAAVMR